MEVFHARGFQNFATGSEKFLFFIQFCKSLLFHTSEIRNYFERFQGRAWNVEVFDARGFQNTVAARAGREESHNPDPWAVGGFFFNRLRILKPHL